LNIDGKPRIGRKSSRPVKIRMKEDSDLNHFAKTRYWVLKLFFTPTTRMGETRKGNDAPIENISILTVVDTIFSIEAAAIKAEKNMGMAHGAAMKV
jgi:hypothetical protein